MSSVISSGSSAAAKCPPLGNKVHWRRSLCAATSERGLCSRSECLKRLGQLIAARHIQAMIEVLCGGGSVVGDLLIEEPILLFPAR
jgi:hypothetical protein